MKIYTIQLTYILFTIKSYSSHVTELDWDIKEISVKVGNTGYQYSFSVNEENKLYKLSVTWNGVTTIIDETMLPKIYKPMLMNISFPTVAPINVLEPSKPTDDMILVIPYNIKYLGSNEKPSVVVDAVRLRFIKGKLELWESSEAVEGQYGKWKCFTYTASTKKLTSDGVVESLLNEYVLFDYTKH